MWFRKKPVDGGLAAMLGQPHYYRSAIDALHTKLSLSWRTKLYEENAEGFSFAQVYYQKRAVSALLANDISGGDFIFHPARINDIELSGKLRRIFSFPLFERIIHRAVYDMVAEFFHAATHANVYSYIKGRGKYAAIQAFSHYLRAHRDQHKNPLARGLYTLRGDIQSYGESIPVHPNSQLWKQLHTLFENAYARKLNALEHNLLEQLLRPTIATHEGNTYQLIRGIADGSPLSVLLLNLYAAPLDAALSSIEGGFYARYGDDIVFCHPDRHIFEQAMQAISHTLAALSLTLNPQKTREYFFNGAGRAADGFTGSCTIDYLGHSVDFSGATTLKTEKRKTYLRAIKQHVACVAREFAHLPPDEKGRMLCSEINKLLDKHSAQAHSYSALLLRQTDDRKALRHVDYLIARIVARGVTGQHGVKHFRTIPYRKIRKNWRLHSLEYARNH